MILNGSRSYLQRLPRTWSSPSTTGTTCATCSIRRTLYRKGTDVEKIKDVMLERLEAKGAKFPAEHNVGHMYEAEQTLKAFYEDLDPTNTFNPGIGKTKKSRPVPFT